MDQWLDGDFEGLLKEGRIIQRQLEQSAKKSSLAREESEVRTFARLMFQGKVKSAIRMISESGRGSILALEERVSNELTETV